MKAVSDYRESIYAGVLGKLLGVYLGRPVEGWTYEQIRERFGEIWYYKNRCAGAPLIVPDDDLSGTFAFYRALEDNGYPRDIAAAQIGDSWLNYIVENQTILWWGGLSRSTEHTAYLRLKNGIQAPRSGSVELNGKGMAEQIGAEIFIDTWAMVNPGDPERAVLMAREAAQVSHGGIAVEAACYLAAMEAMAFDEQRVEALLDGGLRLVKDEALRQLVGAVREQCAKTDDWHAVRSWLAAHHGYDRYPGNCPVQTNHMVLLMALILGGDDFHRALMIASSAGWDTDCNSGNVGALNGIRLGLTGIEAGSDLRGPVADRMYLCTADGGECLTDAVREAQFVFRAAQVLRGETQDAPQARFTFAFAGSTQGFVPYPDCTDEQALAQTGNARESTGEPGLLLRYRHLARGTRAAVSVDTFLDMQPKGREGTSYFEVVGSPSLYATQRLRALVCCREEENPRLRFFIDRYDGADALMTVKSEPFALLPGENLLEWEVPDTGGHAIYRLGLELSSDTRLDGAVVLRWLDWSGAPRRFYMGGAMEMTPALTPWTTRTSWLRTFVSSAENFCPDYMTTFSISHPGENGVVTTGSRDWDDYAVESELTLSQQQGAGLVARARGHRRYYAALLRDGRALLCKRLDGRCVDLAQTPFAYEQDRPYRFRFSVRGDSLEFSIGGSVILQARDSQFASGGAGFLVDSGAMLAHGFLIEKNG